MTKYYGPWLDELPKDALDGSLWQGLHKPDNRTHDFVVVGGEFHHERDGLDAEWCQQFRRVWPPGSVLPEPRPVMENRRIRDFSGSQWWAFKLDGSWRFVKTTEIEEARDVLYLERHPRPWAITESTLCYPVQRFVDGIFIPRPWPDQLGEEQP